MASNNNNVFAGGTAVAKPAKQKKGNANVTRNTGNNNTLKVLGLSGKNIAASTNVPTSTKSPKKGTKLSNLFKQSTGKEGKKYLQNSNNNSNNKNNSNSNSAKNNIKGTYIIKNINPLLFKSIYQNTNSNSNMRGTNSNSNVRGTQSKNNTGFSSRENTPNRPEKKNNRPKKKNNRPFNVRANSVQKRVKTLEEKGKKLGITTTPKKNVKNNNSTNVYNTPIGSQYNIPRMTPSREINPQSISPPEVKKPKVISNTDPRTGKLTQKDKNQIYKSRAQKQRQKVLPNIISQYKKYKRNIVNNSDFNKIIKAVGMNYAGSNIINKNSIIKDLVLAQKVVKKIRNLNYKGDILSTGNYSKTKPIKELNKQLENLELLFSSQLNKEALKDIKSENIEKLKKKASRLVGVYDTNNSNTNKNNTNSNSNNNFSIYFKNVKPPKPLTRNIVTLPSGEKVGGVVISEELRNEIIRLLGGKNRTRSTDYVIGKITDILTNKQKIDLIKTANKKEKLKLLFYFIKSRLGLKLGLSNKNALNILIEKLSNEPDLNYNIRNALNKYKTGKVKKNFIQKVPLTKAEKNIKGKDLKTKENITKYLEKQNLRKNFVNKIKTLNVSEDEYRQFIEYIFRDMIHDGTIGGPKKSFEQEHKYFQDEIIPVLVKNLTSEKYISKIKPDVGISKQRIEKHAKKIMKYRFFQKTYNRMQRTASFQSSKTIMPEIQFKNNVEDLYVVLDSDNQDMIYKYVIQKNKNIKLLKTLGSLYDPGDNLTTSMFGLCVQQAKSICNISKEKKIFINTDNIEFTIRGGDKFESKFEIKYSTNPKEKINVLINGKKIDVLTAKGAAKGSAYDKIGKFMGDFTQIISVIHNNMVGRKTAFGTIDKNAAIIYSFISELYTNYLSSPIFKKLLIPKILFLEYIGNQFSVQSGYKIWFYNLREYVEKREVINLGKKVQGLMSDPTPKKKRSINESKVKNVLKKKRILSSLTPGKLNVTPSSSKRIERNIPQGRRLFN